MSIAFHGQPLKSKNNLGRTMPYTIKRIHECNEHKHYYGFDASVSKSNEKPEVQGKIEASLSELLAEARTEQLINLSYFEEKEGNPGERKWEFGVGVKDTPLIRHCRGCANKTVDKIKNRLKKEMNKAGVRENFYSSIGLAPHIRTSDDRVSFPPLAASTATRSAPIMIPGDNLFTTKSRQPRFDAGFGSRQMDRGGPIERPLKANRGKASSDFLDAGYSSRRGTKTYRNMPG